MNNYFKSGLLLILGLLIFLSSSAQFVHHLEGPAYPWTKTPQIKGDDFRFVIIGDLTGGEQEGVFASVIEKINQLSPDFVICVGDLIDGYTVDSTIMNKQWKNFHERIAKLNAPFFYMPGNHDIANEMLLACWKKQYGSDYYSFTVGKSLFIMMNVYETGKDGLTEKIAPKQAEEIRKALIAHGSKDPIYIFSHPPLWDLFDNEGIKVVAPLLNQNNTTFFCGDRHHYIHKVVNGHDHYMFSKTGGSSEKENLNLGLFNHFFWVTSTSRGISIANILSDGIISTSIVNDQTEKQVNLIRSERWVKIEPAFIDQATSQTFISQVLINNKGDFPLHISGRYLKKDKLSFEPDSIFTTVTAGQQMTIPVKMINGGNYTVDQLPPPELQLTGTYNQDGKIITNTVRKTWVIDNLKKCLPLAGKIEENLCLRPGAMEESWSWSGPDDGSFSFTTSHDEKNIYIKITTKDDVLVVDSLHPSKPQDQLYVHFTSDTSFRKQQKAVIVLNGGKRVTANQHSTKSADEITGSCVSTHDHLFATITIPRSNLKSNFFRLNIGFRDQDDTTSSDQSILWWKPVWGSGEDYPNSGLFKVE